MKKRGKNKKNPVRLNGIGTGTVQEQIKFLKEAVEILENKVHNDCVNSAVMYYRDQLIAKATQAELQFKHVAELKHLNLKFQHRIDYVRGHRIEKVYYADFCDTKNKLVFKIDGGYHDTPEQIKADNLRTRRLRAMGYTVFRITNTDIFQGKTSAFLYNAYRSVGIDILHR